MSCHLRAYRRGRVFLIGKSHMGLGSLRAIYAENGLHAPPAPEQGQMGCLGHHDMALLHKSPSQVYVWASETS
jgi:hypothetical protein